MDKKDIEKIIEDIKNKTTRCVVGLSGGLDSTTLTYLLVKALGSENVIAISFDYNQRHDIELVKAKNTANKLGIKHIILDLSWLGDIVKNVSAMVKGDVKTPDMEDILGDPQPVTYVPYRNQILLSIIASIAESNNCDRIALGVQEIDSYSYWDTTINFINDFQKLISNNRKHNCNVITPFVSLTKSDEIIIGNYLGINYNDTWTCYNPI